MNPINPMNPSLGGTQYSNTKTVLYVDDGKSLEPHKSKV